VTLLALKNARPTIRLVSCALLLAAPAAVEARTVPSADGLRAARAYADRQERDGARVSWAVVDTRGRLYAKRGGRHHRSASQTKAMLLVAYLRGLRAQRVPPAMDRWLRPMIVVSGNRAASRVHDVVGDAGLADVGRAAGMRSLRLNGTWSDVEITAADQARFFARADRLVPPRHRAYARRLLSSVLRRQRWGIAAVADRLGVTSYLKGAWRRRLVNQGALVELRDGRRLAVVVLTDGLRFAAGEAAIRAIAKRLLSPRP
jgi:hypothetical protein